MTFSKYSVSFLLFFCSTLLYGQHSSLLHRPHMALKEWRFQKGVVYNAQSVDFEDSHWEKVTVPHTYSMEAITGVGYYRGPAWYRSVSEIPITMKGQRIFLRFEGVGQEAEVFVNGTSVGTHIGGYAAFCFEITEESRAGELNTIVVKTTNEPNFKRIPVNDKLFNHYGGIYRPVYLFATENTHIRPDYFASSGIFLTLKEHDTEKAALALEAHISSNSGNGEALLSVRIKNKQGPTVVMKEFPVTLTAKDTVIHTSVTIEKPKFWQGRQAPNLYTALVSIQQGAEKDTVAQDFGLRTFEIDPEKGFVLNKEPYRLYGVCMHQEWQQIGPALLTEHHEEDMAQVEEIGAKAVRLSHYQHSEAAYRLADEKGLLVWAEIPFVHDYSGREAENAKQQLKELILQNYNHPSIYVWGLWNEVRAYDSPDEACVTLTKELNAQAHQLDPTRKTTSASDRGMESNMGNLTDLQAWNKYYGWYYGEYEDMGKWLDEYHIKYPSRPVGISEYGVGGNIYHQDSTKLEKPSGDYFPESEQTKYHEITWRILEERPFIWSSFVWNMFDFSVAGWNRGGIPNLNHKGLVTFDRKTKKDAFYFYKAHWSEEPVMHLVGKRDNKTSKKYRDIKIYTNQGKLKLYANGKKLRSTPKVNGKIAVFEKVPLISGENKIKVVGPRGIEDSMELLVE